MKINWEEINFVGQCKRYNISVWACPTFIFVLMSLVIIIAMIGTYLFANRFFEEPEIGALIVLAITLILMIMNYFITNSFTRLAEASRLKSEFINIVSHQMRTPLSALKWSIDFLMNPNVPQDEEKKYVAILKENSNRMVELINNLLEVGRIENGKIEINKKEIFVNEIIKEVVNRLKILAQNNNVEIQFENNSNLPLILADPQKVKTIMNNLIENAIIYTPPGKKVKIYTEKAPKYLKISVEDEGVGIPMEDRSQIFERFFRSQNSFKNQTVGSGLGLYLAKAFTEAQNGKIGFESEENKGSKFWFTLPI